MRLNLLIILLSSVYSASCAVDLGPAQVERHHVNISQIFRVITERNLVISPGPFYGVQYLTEPSDAKQAMSYWTNSSEYVCEMMYTKETSAIAHHTIFAVPSMYQFYGEKYNRLTVSNFGYLHANTHPNYIRKFKSNANTANISPLAFTYHEGVASKRVCCFESDDGSLVVEWDIRRLRNASNENGKANPRFLFQVKFFRNGDIVYVYKQLPPKSEYLDAAWDISMSDAYAYDDQGAGALLSDGLVAFFYHSVDLRGAKEMIGNQTAIYFHAETTCNLYKVCESCHQTVPWIKCRWCQSQDRCTNGLDRRRGEWLESECAIESEQDEDRTCPGLISGFFNKLGRLF